MAGDSTPIRTGVVGVTSGADYRNAGWANIAHLPALCALDSYDVRAVASRRKISALDAAREFGIPRVCSSLDEMLAAEDIELVVVTVRVPAHFDVVTAALDKGKAVFCEWPLANGLGEAVQMVARAQTSNLRCGVGLQARGSPVIRYVRDLVRNGFLGDVVSTSMVGTGMNWGPGMPIRNDYTLDRRNGATLLSIVVGHALDALQHCLGRIREVHAMSALRRSMIDFPEEGLTLQATAEDQWIIAARLDTGCVASIHFRGGDLPGENLHWEINGTAADLVIASHFGNVQPFRLTLRGARKGHPLADMAIPDKYMIVPDLADPVLNVAQHYALFASRSAECATFDDALALHELLDAIERSADERSTVEIVRSNDGG